MNRRLAAFVVVLFLLIPLFAALYYQTESSQLEHEAFQNLDNIVQVKSNQIRRWMMERNGDSLIFRQSQNIRERVEKLIQEPGNPEHRNILKSRLALMLTAYDYEAAMLIDSKRKLLLTTDQTTEIPKKLDDLLKQVLANGSIAHSDFYLSSAGNIYMDWVAPILAEETGEKSPIAAVILRTHADHSFFPDIQSWPIASQSAQILLVENIGDEILYLNAPNPRMSLRRPMRPGFLEAEIQQNTEADTGKAISRDYRGNEVLFAHGDVTGTPWHVIAKVDRAEVLQPLYQTLTWLSGIALLAALTVSIVLIRLFKAQNLVMTLKLQAHKTKAETRLETLGNNIPEGFIFRFRRSPDGQRSFDYLSQGIVNLFGVQPEQAIRNADRLFSLIDDKSLRAYQRAEAKSAAQLASYSQELKFNLPDGQRKWVQFSSQPHRENDGTVVWDGIGLDVTTRKLEEQRVKRLRNLYRDLARISEILLLATNEEELLQQLCHIPVHSGLMKMAWVGIADPDSHRILPKYSAGEVGNYLDVITVSSDAAFPEGCGVTGTAWRTQTPQINNDFQHNPAMAPWANKATSHGWHSSACFPLFRAGKIYAVFTVYNAWPHFFQDQVVAILQSLVSNVGFALDTLDAQKLLHRSEQRSRLILNSANCGICGLDVKGKAIFVNAIAAQMLGYSVDELIDTPMYDTVHHSYPDGSHYERKDCPIYQTLVDGTSHTRSDEVFWRKDGTSFPVEYDTQPIIDDGILVGAVVVFQDISERIRAERKITETSERIELLLHSTRYGILGMDTQGITTFVNAAVTQMLGFTEAELMGRTTHELIHHHYPDGRDYPRENCYLYSTCTSGQAHHVQNEVLWRKDGSSFHVEYDSYPMYRQGQLVGSVLIFQDITERLKLEQENQRREEIYHSIVSQAPDAIVLVDAQTLEFVEFNDAACHGLSYSRDEFAALRLFDIDGEFDAANIRQRVEGFIAERSAHLETLLRTKTGHRLHVMVSLQALHLQERCFLSMIWTDITAMVTMRLQLDKERERLQNIIDGTHAGTWEWNLQTGEAVVNERWAEIIGYQLDELQPFTVASWEPFVHPEDLKHANALLASHLAGQADRYECDVRMRHKNGEWVWIADRGRVTRRDAQGQPLLISGTHVDITARKLSEQQLQQSEERFRKLFDDSKQPLLLADEGRFIDANPATLAMLGFDSLEEFKGTTPAQISPEFQPDGQRSVDKVREINDIALQQGSYRFEWEHLKKDGTPFFAEVMLTPILFGDKTLLHVVWTDITQRKQLEIRLKQFEAIVTSSDDAIISKDLNGKVLSWNAGAERMFGYRAAEMIGQLIGCLLPPECLDEEDKIMAQIQRGEYVEHYETERIRKDGQRIMVSATISPIRNEQGKIVGASKIARDITQRKQYEAELAKLSLTVEQSASMVLITNLQAEIEYVNPRFTEVTGYTAAEVLGKNPRILQSGITPRTTYEDLWATLKAGQTWHGEFTNKSKNGRLLFELAYITPLRDQAGNITHYVASKEDVTEKKRTEQELEGYRQHLEMLVETRTAELEKAKHQAEVANESKSTFLANMSHEIRTPLNSIIGFAHLLHGQLILPEQQEKLAKIIGSGKHLLGIINDILDLSKIEAEKLILEDKTFLVPTTINHVCSMMSDRIAHKGLTLNLEIEPRLNEQAVIGDPLRLGQILINFLSNAAKFTDTGHISLRALIVSQGENDLRLRFEVEDSGIGISVAQQEKLFAAFEQAETSTTRKYGGTGLGLTLSRRLASMMGGETGVLSELGQGSTFWFTAVLKRGQITDVLGEETRVPSHSLAGMRILLVEDNAINQEVAREILERFGLIVDVANHGAEACDKFKYQRYDLILMDMQMPVMDGVEATRRIRTLPFGQQVPILAMTANAFEEDHRLCEAAGMNDFVAKPVEPERLAAIMSKWISGNAVSAAVAPQPSDEQAANTAFAAAPVLDTSNGLKYFNDLAHYHTLLTEFIDTHAHDVLHLEALLNQGERNQAEITAHSLKGLAATFGMPQLKALAAKLEHGLHAGDDLQGLASDLPALATALAVVVSQIRAMNISEVASAEVMNIAELRPTLATLVSLLGKDDMRAYALWRDQQGILTNAIGTKFALPLGRQIENFDFSGALSTLHALFAERPELNIHE